jgi:hypothetical protein
MYKIVHAKPEVLSPEADLRMLPSKHTHKRDIEKRSGEEQYEPWTESQLKPQVNLSLLRSNSLKFQPRIKLGDLPCERQACYSHIATPHPWFGRNLNKYFFLPDEYQIPVDGFGFFSSGDSLSR